MIVNNGTLRTFGIAANASYQRGLGRAAPQRGVVSTVIPSTTGQNEYSWLGKFPRMREWLGDRVVNQMAAFKYAISNRDWESTIEVDRNDIEDDNIGIYAPLFEEMGMSAETHPDELVFGLLKAMGMLRVSRQEEMEGLDVHEHGLPCYASDSAY